MTKDNSERVVRDLFALFSKYERTDLERALAKLESGSATSLLTALLHQSIGAVPSQAQATQKARSKKRAPLEQIDNFLSHLERIGANMKVIEFVGAVSSGTRLRGARALGDFARQLGISIPAKLDRRVVARRIGETLEHKSPDEVDRMISVATGLETRRSSLQEWSKIIVKE